LLGRDVTAYHEAGHAVIGYYRGLTPTRATLIDCLTQSGMVDYSRNPNDPVVTLAGPAAQARYSPQSRGLKHESDTRLALEETGGDLEPSRAIAETLVEQHWNAIDRVAHALLAHCTLKDDILLRTIDPATVSRGRPIAQRSSQLRQDGDAAG
jgi:hypothetical protein